MYILEPGSIIVILLKILIKPSLEDKMLSKLIQDSDMVLIVERICLMPLGL